MTVLSAPSQQPLAKTSPQAVWSLVLGILSITCIWLLGSIPSIILGILAIRKIDQSEGTLKGKGLGIAGIVTGSVGVIVGITPIAMIAAIAFPAFSGVREKALMTKQMSDIRQVAFACRAYAAEHNGDYPKILPMLVTEGYLDSGELLAWKPNPSAEESLPLLYRPGLTDTSAGNEALIAAPQAIGGKRTVAYAYASVTSVPEEEFLSTLAVDFP